MILASIVLYNPDIELLLININSVCAQVDKVLLIDNCSNNKELIIRELEKRYTNIEILENDKNTGIAEALNQALRYAKKNNYEWLLTLDQDSVCEDNMIKKYKEYIVGFHEKNEILLLSPVIQDINIAHKVNVDIEPKEVDVAITSGSLLNVKNSINIGGYISHLFIDYVDFEFCLRGRLKDLKVIKLNNVILYHKLGDIVEKSIFGFKIIVTNHNPIRRYYLFRNKIYIYRTYLGKHNTWIMKNILSSIKTFFIIMLFEKNKYANFKNICKGVKEGFYLNINNK